MPPTWGRQAQPEGEVATHFGESLAGKGHDRIHGDDPIPGVSETIAITGDMVGDVANVEIDITAGQKMISAMSGSLLTSLLGELSQV